MGIRSGDVLLCVCETVKRAMAHNANVAGLISCVFLCVFVCVCVCVCVCFCVCKLVERVMTHNAIVEGLISCMCVFFLCVCVRC